MLPDYELFDRSTTSVVFGLQRAPIQRMLDFDYLCRREIPSVAAIVRPTSAGGFHKAFFGAQETLIPVYRTLPEATAAHPGAEVMINFSSFRSAFPTTMEALAEPTIRTIAVIAEGIPERLTRIMSAQARADEAYPKTIIGPATVGGLAAGAFRIGNIGGTPDNIIASKLYRPGSVGYVGKSGGLANETFNIVARNADGIYEGVATGGDTYPGSTLLDHLLRYEANPKIKMLVCLGELGGTEEYDVVRALQDGRLTKPLIIWVTGTCARVFPTSVQFGHAGAKADSEVETADAKNAALRAAGAIVPDSFDDYGVKIGETYEQLVTAGQIEEKKELKPPDLPMDYALARQRGLVRRPTSFVSTISDDRSEELTYNKVPITQVLGQEIGIGGVIGLLWFKRELPLFARQFIELCLMLAADHGPAVSGSHNVIVTARAGKDLVASLASGLLTIGPRFGGASDGAARYFMDAHRRGLTAQQFVDEMKTKAILIPGIGHRVKSVQNPDMRVTVLKQYAKDHFASTDLLDFALEVEKITTRKRNNLILNVDGCIGICFVDMLESCGCEAKELEEVVDLGYLSGIFVLGRSIGMMGHFFDQQRLKQGLHRHPWDDILYT